MEKAIIIMAVCGTIFDLVALILIGVFFGLKIAAIVLMLWLLFVLTVFSLVADYEKDVERKN